MSWPGPQEGQHEVPYSAKFGQGTCPFVEDTSIPDYCISFGLFVEQVGPKEVRQVAAVRR